MARKDTVFPSKYLKAADLKGRPVVVTIESAPLETLKNGNGEEQAKTVLHFEGKAKTLPLNLTNWDSVADITGEDDTDNWPSHRIELYPAKTEMKGKTVDCIRIRAPAQRELPKPKAPAPKPPLADEMDDEVPF
jgi:hypothetical protein